MRRTTTLLLAPMLAIPLTAQKGAIAFTEFDLDNGLHVIVHEDHGTPIVAVSVMYHVGSKDERADRRGFAHFFEHLLFEGSANIGRGEFSKHVEKAGGVLNANTNGDRTYYYEVLPSNQLELGLWLESERMLHARVDQKGIDTQREVVKEERRQRYENQPYGSILIEVLKRAYTVHPYQWPTIGFMEDLNAASEQDYVDFYKTYYVPNNAVLVVAGDVKAADTRKLVEKYFAAIPRGKDIVRPTAMEPPLKGEVRDVVHDQIQLPAVVQAYRIPAYGTADFYAVDMLNRLLSNGNSSRLNVELKDRAQKALYVGAFSFPFEHPGLAIAFAIANMGVPAEELEKAMDAEFAKVREGLVPQLELEKLKAQLETEFVRDNSRVAGVASNLATAHTFLGGAQMATRELERYLSVTPEDLQRVAKEYFSPDARVVLHYLPKNQKP
ncbi:MAG: insulinase family protein [Flavobacteriales bacterium]|nr:insulinase family protein [Flavobacteriales bacterium]MBK9701364.1 insulinase family protein [Flavobacteriales bacterium]